MSEIFDSKKLEKTKIPFSVGEEIALCEKFTHTYQTYSSQNIYIRETECLRVQYLACLCPPQEGDLFAGRIYRPLIQYSPQPGTLTMGYCIDEEKLAKFRLNQTLSQSQTKQLEELATFWLQEQTKEKIKAQYPKDMKQWLPYDDYYHDRAVAHPLYRISGAQLDFQKLLTLGVDGLHEEIHEKQRGAKGQQCLFYEGLHQSLVLFSDLCILYSEKVESQLAVDGLSSQRKSQLKELRDSLHRIAHAPAHTFRDAIQLTYLWWIYSASRNFARMDVYLSRYYVQDLQSGRITQQEALTLLCGLWRMIEMENMVYDSRIVVGGKGRPNEEMCNQFCHLAIEATRKLRTVVPQLTLRFYQGMEESLYENALQAISEGCTFPLLYNDDVNIPAVAKAFCVSETIATCYCPYGCGEYVLEHQSLGTPSGIINLAKALEVTLNHGKDLETEEPLGLDLGGLDTFKDFNALFSAYKMQVEHFVTLLAKMEEIEYVESGRHTPYLAFSMLYDDCIQRGKGILEGGVRYLGGTLESYGNVNTADSLTALKILLYDNKVVTQEEYLDALKTNYVNTPHLRRMAMDCPKYGNELRVADEMLLKVHEHICTVTRESVHATCMHSYLTVIINNDANTVLGHLTSATADGRLSGEYLANANNPQGGADRAGITAMLNSIVQPPIHYHAGSVQNLKLNKELFSPTMKPVLNALLATYFAKGGAQLMITVVNAQEMEDALLHPENHGNLLVRVGGFSARFVELGADVQKELLSRVLHG